jgi:prepilin-type N-terminal cleavage/methylation domain-containing protein
MKAFTYREKTGFTLLETVIAIGVLAVLLTGFLVVFGPATAGIRKSINIEEADRLASTVEQELVTLRGTQEVIDYSVGFNKAYAWIRDSGQAGNAILVYQYRAAIGNTPLRNDQTPAPVVSIQGLQVGKDYTVMPMVRRVNAASLAELNQDLSAVEGPVFVVKCTQLIFKNGVITVGTPGKIVDPKGVGPDGTSGNDYPDAVIAFTADFFLMPNNTAAYFSSPVFTTNFTNLKTPVFSRNLAVHR